MEQFKLKLGRCFALISNQLGDLICLLLGAAIFIEQALAIVQHCNDHTDKRSLLGALALLNSPLKLCIAKFRHMFQSQKQ